MFTKLLKHEWRATKEMLGTVCLVCLGASLLGGLTMRYLMWASTVETSPNAIVVLSVLGLTAAIIAVAITGVAALFLYISRFYKSRFTDEGYLTFTLPVNTHQNLLASMANTAIGMVIVFFVICACLGLWLMIGLSGIPEVWTLFREKLPELWHSFVYAMKTIPWEYVGLFLLNTLTGGACALVVLMLSVTIGSILARKHKVLVAVGVYYGINVALSMVGSATMALQVFPYGGEAQTVVRVFCSSSLLTAVVAVAGYFLMYWLIDKKLNLN